MTALRALVTVTASALFLFIAAFPMLVNPPVAYTGAHLAASGALVGPTIVRIDPRSPAFRAGLRAGDIVSCLSERDKTVLLPEWQGSPSPYVSGSSIPLCALRSGAWQSFRVFPEVRPAIGYLYGSVWIALLRLAVFAVFLLVGILLVMARPGWLTWIFFAYCLGGVPSYATWINDTVFPPALYAVMTNLLGVFVWSATEFMLLFALLVPNDRVPAGWRRTATWLASILTIGQIAFAIFQAFRPDLTFADSVQVGINDAVTAAVVLVVIVRLAVTHGEERARFAWAAFAIVLGLVINDVRNQLASGPLGGMGTLFGVLTIVMPVALMYAILKRHVIDVRFVISRTVVYAAITTLVVGIIGIVDWATSAYLMQARVAMAIDALVTIALGFALHRTYRWLESAVDLLLFRKKHAAEAYLHRLGRTLLRAGREETIDGALVHDPYDKLVLTMAALFRAQGSVFALSCTAGWNHPDATVFDADHDLVRFLATERKPLHLADLRSHVWAQLRDGEAAPAIVIPIFQGDDLAAFALYGVHREGTKLDPDEVQALEALCEVAAQAYTRVENMRYRELVQLTALSSHT